MDDVTTEVLRIILEARDQASETLRHYANTVDGVAEHTNHARDAMRAMGGVLTGTVVAGLAVAVKAATDYQTMLVHLQSNTGITNAELGTMSDGIKTMASETGAPLDQLSEGFMRIHNSGFSAADSLKILKPAMESALSTGDDTGKVAAALGVAMHEFHIGTDQATVSMNLLHTAAQLGNSTLGEFADGTTKALNLAGGFGLSLVDVAAALSTLTQSGQTARNASDGLSSAMSGFVKPTTSAMTMVQTLSKETGVNLVADFSAAGLKSRGLANAIGDVHLAIARMGGETATQRQTLSDYADQLTATGNITDAQFTAKMTAMASKIHDPTAALLQLFPNIRAFREMMLLTGSQSDAFGKNLSTLGDVMAGKLDPTLKGFAAQQQTMAAQMAKLETNSQILAINLGTALLPAVTAIAMAVVPVVQRFADWSSKHEALVIGLMAAAGAVGALTVAVTFLGPALAVVGALIGVAIGPIGLLILAAAGLYEAWQHDFGGIREETAKAWGAVRPVFEAMQTAFGTLQQAFKGGGIGGAFAALPGALAPVEAAVASLGPKIQAHLPAVIAAMGDLASRVVTYIRAAAPVLAGQMLAWGNALIAWVQPYIGPLLSALGSLLSRLGSWIVNDAAPVVIKQLEAWGSALVAWIAPRIGPMLSAAGDLLGKLGDWITGPAATAVGNKLGEWGAALVAWVGPHIQPMLHSAGDLLNQFGIWIAGPAANAIGNKLSEWGTKFIAWIVPAAAQFLRDWPGHLNDFLTAIHDAAGTIAGRLGAWAGAFTNWIIANDVPRKLLTAFVAVNAALLYFIGSTVAVIATNLGMWAMQFWNWLDPAGTFAALGPSFNKLLDSIGNWIKVNAVKDITTALHQWADALWGWVQEVWPKLQGELGKLLGTITHWVTHDMADAVKKAATTVGKDMIQGTKDGVTSLAGGLGDHVVGVFKGAGDKLDNFLGRHSPSKLYYDVGVDMMQGTINALLAKRHELNDTMVSLATTASDVFSQAMAKAGFTAAQSFGMSFGSYFTQGNSKLGEGELSLPSDRFSAQGSITPAGANAGSDEVRAAIVATHTAAVAAALPTIQQAHTGLAKAATAALVAGFGQGTPAVVSAVQAMVGAATQAGQQLGSNFATIAADAAQRLKNLATTGNINGVVAGQQASAAPHVDQSSITPAVSNADAIRANFAALTGQTQQVSTAMAGVATSSQSTASALATSLAMLKDQTILLPDMLKSLTDAKTLQDLTNAVQAAHTSLLKQENGARAQGNTALLASLQGQQQALGIQQQVEASLIRQVDQAQTLANKANQTLATDQQRLSTLQQQEDAADQALATAQENLQTVQDTLKTQQDQLNLKLAYDPSHAAQQGQLDAMAVQHAKTVLSLDSQIQAAKDAHNSTLVTQLTNQKSLLDTQYSDQRGVLEALAQQSNNAYQSQQTQLSDLQQQQNINNQLKTAQDKVAAAAKKDADAHAAVQGQQAVVDAATVAANKATQAWKDAISNRTKEDNTATARAIQNATGVQNKITDDYNLQIRQIKDLSNLYAGLNVVKAGGVSTGATAAAAGNAGAIAGAVSQPSATLQQAIADATKQAPKAMHDFGSLMANLLAAGLAQGLTEQGAITYALRTLSQGMQQQFTQDWDMHSPSRVAEAYGRNIVAGLVGGIRASKADAHAALGGLLGGPSGSGGAAGGSVTNHVTVHVSGQGVSVSGTNEEMGHALAGAIVDALVGSQRTTSTGARRLLPGVVKPMAGV